MVHGSIQIYAMLNVSIAFECLISQHNDLHEFWRPNFSAMVIKTTFHYTWFIFALFHPAFSFQPKWWFLPQLLWKNCQVVNGHFKVSVENDYLGNRSICQWMLKPFYRKRKLPSNIGPYDLYQQENTHHLVQILKKCRIQWHNIFITFTCL